MKKMVCEICGSQQIKKEDGVFICKECGTEYSLEEAKKLLTEITDDIDVEKDANIASKQTLLFAREKTDVCGKDELIYQLYLWIKSLSGLQGMTTWFNLPLSTLKSSSFWASKAPFDKYTEENVFPHFKGLDQDPTNLTSRIFDGKSLIDTFRVSVSESPGYQSSLKRLLPYTYEMTNSSANLYKKTAYKYRICMNGKNITTLNDVCNHIGYDAYHALEVLGSDSLEIYYSEFSKMWGSEKVYHAVEVEKIVRNFGRKCKESANSFIEIKNKEIDIYRGELAKVKEIYNELIANCFELETSLFIPYEYRDLNILMNMLNIVRSGKATTWKELINLYDTTIYREKVVYNLETINENMVKINQTLITGFTIVNESLMTIHSTIKSIDLKISSIDSNLSKGLSAIKRNTFITMWNTL